MRTKEQVKKMLDDMSVNEKALVLNLMRCTKFTGTPLCPLNISEMFEGYDKTNNIIIDSFIWNAFGIHYKDYVASGMGPFLLIDPIKLEKKIDHLIHYWMEELGQLTEN